MAALTQYHGETKTWNCTATDDGAAQTLVGAIVYFVARLAYPAPTVTNDATAEISLSTIEGSIVITDEDAGEFSLTVSKTKIASLHPCTLIYSVMILLCGETDAVVFDTGTFEILPNARAS
jgi:hypothetical protein